MSRKGILFFIFTIAVAAGLFFAYKQYTKDKILSFKSDISSVANERLFVEYLIEHKGKSTFLDITLGDSQKRNFLDEIKKTNYIHLRSFDPKRYEYIFITDEDKNRDLLFDNNSSRIKSLFTIDIEKNSKDKSYIYLRSISPSDLSGIFH